MGSHKFRGYYFHPEKEIENYDMVSGEQEVGSVISVGDGIANHLRNRACHVR